MSSSDGFDDLDVLGMSAEAQRPRKRRRRTSSAVAEDEESFFAGVGLSGGLDDESEDDIFGSGGALGEEDGLGASAENGGVNFDSLQPDSAVSGSGDRALRSGGSSDLVAPLGSGASGSGSSSRKPRKRKPIFSHPPAPKFKVHTQLSDRLKPHQRVGSQFVWSHVAAGNGGRGCILADYMGLGKTLQLVSVITSFMDLRLDKTRSSTPSKDGAGDSGNSESRSQGLSVGSGSGSGEDDDDSDEEDGEGSGSEEEESEEESDDGEVGGYSRRRPNTALVVAPAIVVQNWNREFEKWLSREERKRLIKPKVLDSSNSKTLEERVQRLKKWKEQGGVLLIGYEMFRLLAAKGFERHKAALEAGEGGASAAGSSSASSKGSCGNKIVFRSSAVDHKKRLEDEAFKSLCCPGPDLIILDEGHRLRKDKTRLYQILTSITTRRRVVLTGYPLQNHLREYWCMVDFASPGLIGSKETFKRRFEIPITDGLDKDSTDDEIKTARRRSYVLGKLLETIVIRRDGRFLEKMLPPKHEWVLHCRMSPVQGTLYRAFLKDRRMLKEDGERSGGRDLLASYAISISIVNHPDILLWKMREKQRAEAAEASAAAQRSRGASANRAITVWDDDEDDLSEEYDAGGGAGATHALNWARPTFEDNYQEGDSKNSGKMRVLLSILRYSCLRKDSVVVFSQSLQTLNIIQRELRRENKRRGSDVVYNHLRIDGSTSMPDRTDRILKFNSPKHASNVMLISTKAGGEGVNLVGANRIVLYDCCWNPCHDHEAMCRIHRYGQTKPSYIYRLVGAGTMEKKIYELQLRKVALSKRIIDRKATERHFRRDQLNEFFDVDAFKSVLKDKKHLRKVQPKSDSVLQNVLRDAETGHIIQGCYPQKTFFDDDEDGECKTSAEQQVAMDEYESEAAREAAYGAGYSAAPPPVADDRTTILVELTVPDGVLGGAVFNVAFGEQTYEVACPVQSKAGDKIRIRLPRVTPAAAPAAPPAVPGEGAP